jgi:tRNA(Ile)-lysidine synthase
MSGHLLKIDNRQFPVSQRFLVGVSGGRDSVALLHQLLALGYRDLVVCHLNHKLRGRAGDADARFVEKLAAKHDVDLAIGPTDVRAFAAKKKMSIETAARECRYNFFARIAKQKRCRTIFLAHHADDLVETFLLNLFRGAGTSGLAAMREVTTRRIADVDLTLFRPMLATWRSDIDKYVRKHRLPFREDASNKNIDATRNRIRHRVIPYLEKTFGRNIRQNIWRTAMIAAEEESFFDVLIPQKLATLAVKPLRNLSTALQRRTLRRWLRDANVPDIGFDLIERVRQLADSTAQIAKTNLPQDRHVRRRAGKLFIE